MLDPRAVCAVVPCHLEPPQTQLVADIRRRVGEVLVVADGVPRRHDSVLARLAELDGVDVVRLPETLGKGTAVASGIDSLLGSQRPPEAVLIVDADGQHPPEAIPAFLEAAESAELVIGDRFGDLGSMPWQRRLCNRAAAWLLARRTGSAVRDTQCGMRLLRGRALTEIRFPPGRYEAETVHLKRCLLAGVAVAWVPIPALYEGFRSSFRAIRDLARVLIALIS